jgi:type VI secretion system protein ImpA
MAQIRHASEADDAHLPMGEWERPLKVADWLKVMHLCRQTLAERSKDLQIAVWWLEAAVYQHQADGLVAGIELLCGLIERFWADLHPQIDEDGDCESRIAPLVWLNETLPLVLRLDLILLPLLERKPPRLTLEDWDRQNRGLPNDDENTDHALPPRDLLRRIAAQPEGQAHVRHLHACLHQAQTAWARLNTLVDEQLGLEGPSLSRVADTLNQLQRITAAWHIPENSQTQSLSSTPNSGRPIGSISTATSVPNGMSSMELDSRESAYFALEKVADYLQAIEPHSPTPYLIRRAVNWGKLPLPQLMQVLMREEGDLNRLFSLLVLPSDASD